METKQILILSISLVIIFGIIILIILAVGNKNLSPENKQLGNCNLIEYNGKDKTNIVLFSDPETSKQYADYLLSQEPYLSNKQQMNFYYIDDYPPKCEIYKGIAILCYSKELIKRASACPTDLIVVLKNENSEIRSSAYMNVMSLNLNHPKSVLLHEIGHALANLADEYIPSKIPSKSKNCQKSCNVFNEECFQGCSDNEHFRSIDNGVMKTLNTEDYGEFNKKIISEKLSKNSQGMVGFVTENEIDCSNQEYILIEGNYNQGKIEIQNKNIEIGCLGTNGAGDFEYRIIGTSISEGEFNPGLIFTDSQKIEEQNINGGAIEYEGNFLLKIPIIENAKTLEIIKDEKILTEINLEDVDSRPCKK